MEFEVDTSVAGVVEAWSVKRLPFEPTGWLAEFRGRLAAACRGLTAAPGQVLHAVYASADRSRCDLENILTNNLGTSAIRAAATNGLTLERRITAERGFPHHYRYALAPDTSTWTAWDEGRPLGALCLTAPPATFSAGEAGAWWLAARRGALTVHVPSATVPDAYLLRLTVDPPPHWRGGIAGLLKPLTDGVIAALHTHSGPVDTVAERAAAVDHQLSAAEFTRLLTEHRDVPLGAVRLVAAWGNTVQWHPADDQIVGLDARIVRTGQPGTVTATSLSPNQLILDGAYRISALCAPCLISASR